MLEKRVKAAIGDRSLSRSRSPLAVRVMGEVGGYLTVELTDSDGRVVTATGTVPLAEPTGSSSSSSSSAAPVETTKKQGGDSQDISASEGSREKGGNVGSVGSSSSNSRRSTLDVLQQHVAKAIGALGDTPFSVGTLDMTFGRRGEDGVSDTAHAVALPYLSGAEVKALRKDAVIQLLAQRAADPVQRTRVGLHSFDGNGNGCGIDDEFILDGSKKASVDESEPLAPLLRAEATATARNAVALTATRQKEEDRSESSSTSSPPRFAWGSFGVLCRNQAQVCYHVEVIK